MQLIHGRQYFPVRSFQTLREMLDQCVGLYGSQTAFRFRERLKSDPVTRTYAEFQRDYQALGTALIDLGLSGRRLAVIGENSYEWCLSFAAIVNGTGVVVPLDRLLPEDEILGLLSRGEVEGVFYDPAFHAVVQRAARLLPQLRVLICMRPERQREPVETADPAPARRLPDLMQAGGALLDNGDRRYLDRTIDPNTP